MSKKPDQVLPAGKPHFVMVNFKGKIIVLLQMPSIPFIKYVLAAVVCWICCYHQ